MKKLTNTNSKILVGIQMTLGKIQKISRNHYGRKLNGLELNRIEKGWRDDESVLCQVHQLEESIIEMAMDEQSDWSKIDKEYIKRKHLKV